MPIPTILLTIIIFFSTFSCSHFSSTNNSNDSGNTNNASKKKKFDEIKTEKVVFDYSDSTGDYRLVREVGKVGKVAKDRNNYFVKTQILPENGDEKNVLENIFAISNLEELHVKGSDGKSGVVKTLTPKISQYTVWLEGQKYFSQLKVDYKKRMLEVLSIDEEKKVKDKTKVKIPKKNSITCFFSQVDECIRVTGFLTLAKEKKAGSVPIQLIWDGHPFFQEQYNYLPKNIFSNATFEYDGELEDGTIRFALNVEGQSILYHFSTSNDLIKKLWVNQGITQERSTIK
ncbi:MAG: hypothetical protein HQK49_02335 [Oligoflexia bacterium]|nr:hypothetical protein [Oligoflexia bacterium]